ncbi:FHA domain-containing protein [Nocardioides sp. zg-536]|uniref:FHA domain-containing protein n=1 Tax=Nocardioides faecalis TaxID=2803858 RepID=A0A939BXU4_9ACTN|nr:FHA domain-containing protein [Nocardioides faecalis]MBM9459220.1 FHA domain-containing protein [Nocardioides faecalis]MBS4751468.1 FHA domain-containing protein [Nocardioides faecalis]QVI59643.1 FHA domain-containing protein [Nocardioides faecalis]
MSICPSGHTSQAEDYCDTCGLPIPPGGAPAGGAPAAAGPDEAASGAPSGPSAGSAAGASSGASAGDAAGSPADAATCPNCDAVNPPNALFCEACGYDFTTGSMPRPVTPSILDLDALLSGATPPAPADTGSSPAPSAPSAPSAPVASPSVAPPLTEAWVAEVWIDPDWYAEAESDDPLPSAGVPTVVALRSTSILVGRASRSRGISPDIDLSNDNGISRRHCQLTTDGRRWWVEDLGSSNGTYLGTTLGSLPSTPVPAGEKRELGPDARLYLGAWTRIVIRRAQPGEV